MTRYYVRFSQRIEVFAKNEYEAHDIAVAICDNDSVALTPHNMIIDVMELEEQPVAC